MVNYGNGGATLFDHDLDAVPNLGRHGGGVSFTTSASIVWTVAIPPMIPILVGLSAKCGEYLRDVRAAAVKDDLSFGRQISLRDNQLIGRQ